MTSLLNSINPQNNATVSASAGTGKTWLLVSRLIRLLLSGAQADSIIAITFTRKAAAEMQTRLSQRLLELATCEEQVLIQLLQQLGADTRTESLKQARNLYEQLLHATEPIRISTFHAFCQDILRRFPLEADVPPGFTLSETTADLETMAWDSLVAEATQAPDQPLAKSLEILFENCNGIFNTKNSLFEFLNHRSDWWAYTDESDSPVEFAVTNLKHQLDINPDSEPLSHFFDSELMSGIEQFITLLNMHPIKNNADSVESLSHTLSAIEQHAFKDALAYLKNAFLTKKGDAKVRKETSVQAKKMGEKGQQRFLELHQSICDKIFAVQDKIARLHTYQINQGWYTAGARLLYHYQHIKLEQRLLDFADLEWKTYTLLNNSDNAQWVQYKMDQRIDHLLIDEFQDTNPTQWRLILPLLEEFASREGDKQRSAFIVGDSKQSIYRFRRANPKLLTTAQQWLEKNMQAIAQPLNKSWRSAPAIIEFINRVFSDGPLAEQLVSYSTHDTHQQELWGHAELLPLIESEVIEEEESPSTHAELRNSLLEPRILKEDTRYQQEANIIVEKIQTLIREKTIVGKRDEARPLEYGDIIILLRQRTHAQAYQQALRDAQIPYIGTERGTLLDSLEVRDIVALLDVLYTPYNNLSLATVLSSPIFSCNPKDLMDLASLESGHWMHRLHVLSTNLTKDSTLHRANRLLSQWQTLAGSLPVHDLLDRIYNEGDVLNRYQAAFPAQMRQRVVANLVRFIELALEVDSGRYPSIGLFLTRLRTLSIKRQDSPDEAPADLSQSCVHVMTIHGAKGLEAPVVFLADSAVDSKPKSAYQSLVDWPSSAAKPLHFFLSSRKEDLDSFSQGIIQQNQQADFREQTNLLYVALTRAKQILYVSGCRPHRSRSLGWYGAIRQQLISTSEDHSAENEGVEDFSTPIVIESGEKIQLKSLPKTEKQNELIVVDPRLSQPIELQNANIQIAPSHAAQFSTEATTSANNEFQEEFEEEDNRVRGIIIHRFLELLNEGTTKKNLLNELDQQKFSTIPTESIERYAEHAIAVFTNPQHKNIFSPNHYQKAYNEVAIQYLDNEKTVHGYIDRLVIYEDSISVIDYKTHQDLSEDKQQILVKYYRPQMELYVRGVERLWPEKKVRGLLLFCEDRRVLEV